MGEVVGDIDDDERDGAMSAFTRGVGSNDADDSSVFDVGALSGNNARWWWGCG